MLCVSKASYRTAQRETFHIHSCKKQIMRELNTNMADLNMSYALDGNGFALF